MFHNDWVLQQIAEEQRRDLMRQLATEQLIREVKLANHPQRHTMYHVLDRVGQHLIQWGEWLRARHAAYHSSLSTSQEISHG